MMMEFAFEEFSMIVSYDLNLHLRGPVTLKNAWLYTSTSPYTFMV
jgi:hypothetical protein